MINEDNTVNEITVNSDGISGAVETVTDSIFFDDFEFSCDNFLIDTLELDHGGNIDFESFDIPRSDGEEFTGFYRRQKPIPIGGMITATDIAELQTILHNLKTSVFDKSEKWLKITENGNTTKYKATLDRQTSAIQRGKLITMRRFDFNFTVLKGSGEDLVYVSKGSFNQDNLNFVWELENTGQTKTEPIFIFIFSEATNISEISIDNETTGDKFKFLFPSGINAGDVLRLDIINTKFELNGTEVDYIGPPPFLETGKNSVRIKLIGTSATFDLTGKFKKRYI